MKNKGAIIISCLSQIVLLILLIQMTGLLKLLTLGMIFLSTILVLVALATEKRWRFDSWMSFYINIVLLMAVLIYSSKDSLMDAGVIVLLVVMLVINFFIMAFTETDKPKRKSEKPEVKKKKATEEELALKIVDVGESIIRRKKETPVGQKKSAKKAPKDKKKEDEGAWVSLKESEKYHKPDCGYVKNARKNRKTFYKTEKQAQNKGLRPCGLCTR